MNTKAPKVATDIEPNNKNNQIKNIITKNNFNGIIIYLVNLAKEKKYNIGDILIQNQNDYNSRSALAIRIYSKKNHDNKILKGVAGKIIIKDNSYFGKKNVYKHHPDIKFNPKIKFQNVKYYKRDGDKYLIGVNFNDKLKSSLKDDGNVQYIP